LRSPSTGGVYASFASLADLIWAEPGAYVAFAGPRVVEVVTGVAPPDESHRAEAALEAGIVDAVVATEAARDQLALLLGATRAPGRRAVPEAPAPPTHGGPDHGEGDAGDPWNLVTAARTPDRL